MEQELEKSKGNGSVVDLQRRKELKNLQDKHSKTQMKAEQLGLEY